MSEFVYVVVGAIGLLVIGGVLAGFAPQAATSGEAVTGESLFFEQIGTVGALQDVDSTSRVINLGDFTVEEQSPEKTMYTEDELVVQNGFRSQSTELIEFDAFRPLGAELSFVQTSGTDPANLIVTVNGKPVAVPSYETGQRATIHIPADVLQQGANTILLEAEDPGYAVWRNNRFVFRNVELVLNDLEHSQTLVPFRAFDYEVNGFDRGELTFSVGEGTVESQDLLIAINGNQIQPESFDPSKRALPYEITFFANTSGVRFGENVLSFKTTGDAVYDLETASLKLFYFATNQQRTVVRDIDISEVAYRALGKKKNRGRVSFDVERVFVPGEFRMQFGNKTWTFNPTPGENVRTFDQDDVETGANELRLSTDGSYRITDFNMTIVEK